MDGKKGKRAERKRGEIDEDCCGALSVLIICAVCCRLGVRYLWLASVPSHDLSSTFIPKPSAPLAKQRKKGRLGWGFTAALIINILSSFPFFCLSER